jgi:hypothetical protein
MPDYLFIRYETPPGQRRIGTAEVLWIEFKRPGEKPTKKQIAWKEAEERRGALCWVVDSIDGFPERYRASGLQRKAIS